MRLRRMCLVILGFTMSAGICGIWFALQTGAAPMGKEYTEEISIPAFVQGTELLVEEILSYEGEFIEDTEFGEYVFATGLILRNTSDKGILRARVKLTGKNDTLDFDATYIPPGEAVLVLEKNRKETQDTQFVSCAGTVEYDDINRGICKDLLVRYLPNDSVEITNTTENTMVHICVYYKTAYDDGLFYMGGLTHCYRIKRLVPGESITVFPDYFISNCSDIVHISGESTELY